MNKNSIIYVAGHNGMVGSAIARKLNAEGYSNVLIANRDELDLRDQRQVETYFRSKNIQYVFLAAAKVGGIYANQEYPAEFVYDNLMIQSNIINQAYKNNVERLLFLGSSCIYPKMCKQPIKEEYLMTGSLESTNEPYAIAKIAGINLCKSYNRQYNTDLRCLMPTNLYGPNDNFNPQNSHVIPGMMYKFYKAKQNSLSAVELWGTGTPKREFLHIDDLVSACLFIMTLDKEKYRITTDSNYHINVGSGKDITINELSLLIKEIVGYKGKIEWNTSMPDGTPRKLLDVERIEDAGWKATIELRDGLQLTYEWLLNNIHEIRE